MPEEIEDSINYFKVIPLNKQLLNKLILVLRIISNPMYEKKYQILYIENKKIKRLFTKLNSIDDIKTLINEELNEKNSKKCFNILAIALKIFFATYFAAYINNVFSIYTTYEVTFKNKKINQTSLLFGCPNMSENSTTWEETKSIFCDAFSWNLIVSQIIGVIWATSRVFITTDTVNYCVKKPIKWLCNKVYSCTFKSNNNELNKKFVDNNEFETLKQFLRKNKDKLIKLTNFDDNVSNETSVITTFDDSLPIVFYADDKKVDNIKFTPSQEFSNQLKSLANNDDGNHHLSLETSQNSIVAVSHH